MSIPSHYSSTQKHNLSAHRITIPSHAKKNAHLSGHTASIHPKYDSNFVIKVSVFAVGLLTLIGLITWGIVQFCNDMGITPSTTVQATLKELPHTDVPSFSPVIPEHCTLKSATPITLELKGFDPLLLIREELLCKTDSELDSHEETMARLLPLYGIEKL